jgi:hypothetical protein
VGDASDVGDGAGGESSGDDAGLDASVGGVGGADAGMGGADASLGGADAGGTAGQASDSQNAFVSVLPSSGDACGRFESFGSDRFGTGDIQAGFGIARAANGCPGYLAGLAGREAWRLIGSDPQTLLSPGGDAIPDGFIARFEGGPAFSCNGSGVGWSVRLESSAAVVADRVAARRCSGGVTATAFIRGAAGRNLSFEVCRTSGGCQLTSASAALGPDSTEQIVVMDLDDNGDLAWHGAFGPVSADPDAAAGIFVGRPHVDLALDSRDHIYVLLTTTGSPTMHNVASFGCDELEEPDRPAGTWLVRLERGGYLDQAYCRWARHMAL